MKTKIFTPTKAKLPSNEQFVGSDASPKLFNNKRAKAIDAAFKKHKRRS